MIDSFISNIEETFGKYKSGMRIAIENKLQFLSDVDFMDLLKFLTEDYDMARPPSLKVIMGEVFKHSINLGSIQTSYYVSVCENCNREFSHMELRCPQCQSIRKYGLSKKLLDKPIWWDDEIKRNIKESMEAEDRKRSVV